MSDGVHLLIPFATCSADACREALARLPLPRLARLLARLMPDGVDGGSGESLSMPHERVLARAFGIPAADGLIPFAAWQLLQAGHPQADAAWAWITPTHWRVGTDRVQMALPQQLQLDAADSQALLAAMQPYFAEDGITLEYDAPLRWLARSEQFRALPSASLDRVLGRDIDRWLPQGDAGRPLRRLQQEMQMLLYTLPLNDERQRGGLLPVNSFWVSGTGALPPGRSPQPDAPVHITHYLRDAALQQDWAAWAAAWQQIDERECTRLLGELDAGRAVRLTLCGERGAASWSSRPGGAWRRLATLFSPPSPAALLEPL